MITADVIYKRLLLNAARAWGYTPEEMEEEGFDPLVGLMLGGLSKELEKAYQELEQSKGRIISDLAQHLTPDVLTGVLPTHGILHAQPIEVKETVETSAQFYTEKKVENSNEQIVFAPIDNYEIIKANIKYIVYRDTLYEQKLHKKERFLKTKRGKKISGNEVWLGIDIDKRVENFNGFRFFMDWSFDRDKLEYLKYLPLSKWYYGEKELDIKFGLDDKDDDLLMRGQKQNYLTQVQANVKSIYQDHFMFVKNSENRIFRDENKSVIPTPLVEVFGEEDLQKLKGSVVWVKVVFPQLLSHKSLELLNCNLNCFPVINCKYHSRNINIKEKTTFFPLKSDGSFLSMSSILDKLGTEVHDKRFLESEEQRLSYVFKQTGIQRFDDREAAALLDYLFDVLRDESYAFHKYNMNIQSSSLKNLRQQVNALIEETKSSKKFKFGNDPFLIFSALDVPQIVKISYSSTMGEIANKISAGTPIKVLKGVLVDSTSLAMVTGTWGGRSFMEDQDKIRLFKHALISRNALVTKLDIKAFCLAKLGSVVEGVTIKNGSEISLNDSEGIIRTMVITLKLTHTDSWDENEFIYLTNNLKTEIENKSCFLYPIRIVTEVA